MRFYMQSINVFNTTLVSRCLIICQLRSSLYSRKTHSYLILWIKKKNISSHHPSSVSIIQNKVLPNTVAELTITQEFFSSLYCHIYSNYISTKEYLPAVTKAFTYIFLSHLQDINTQILYLLSLSMVQYLIVALYISSNMRSLQLESAVATTTTTTIIIETTQWNNNVSIMHFPSCDVNVFSYQQLINCFDPTAHLINATIHDSTKQC